MEAFGKISKRMTHFKTNGKNIVQVAAQVVEQCHCVQTGRVRILLGFLHFSQSLIYSRMDTYCLLPSYFLSFEFC